MKLLLTLSIFLSSTLFASYGENARIFSLLPTMNTPLAVEPHVPRDFVAMSKEGTLDLQNWVYWGPKEALERYFKDPATLDQSFLRVRLSETVKQIAATTFSQENDALCKLMAPMGLKRLFDVRMQWGKYPIYLITAEFDKKWLYAGWVGLSDTQGTTLMFELVYPGEKPSAKDFQLWDLFFDKTTTLANPTYSEGFSVRYTTGITDVTLYGKRFSIHGEQRYSDKLLVLHIDPENSSYKPAIETVSYAYFFPEANGLRLSGGPSAYVTFTVTSPDNKVYTHTIPVLVASVDDFSKERVASPSLYEHPLPCMLKEYLK